MKYLFVCILFAPIIWQAFRQKKWYLYLFVGLAAILPEQFAVEIHEKLPLLSATRVLILVLMAFWLYEKIRSRSFFLPASLLLFLGVNVIISCVNFSNGFDEFNRIFRYVFERVLVVIMVADLIKTREEFDRCVDFMIMGAMALAVIGIVQSVFDYDIASVLHLQETLASVSISQRMGMTRAYGTFNAISYGCYCAFMVMVIVYRLYKTGHIKYSAAFAVNFMALICTFTRSAWLCVAGILVLMLLVCRMKLIRRMLPSVGLVIALCVVLCVCQPKLFGALVETGKSSVNTLLAVIPDGIVSEIVPTTEETSGEVEAPPVSGGDIGAETPPVSGGNVGVEIPPVSGGDIGFELSEDFGLNGEDPTYSRVAQWTAVEYMAMEGKLLFGYGYNALPEGKLHYFYDRWSAQWKSATYLDVGLVALITESGLIGALAHMALLGYMLAVAIRRKKKLGSLDFYELTIYTIPLYLLLNILAAFLQATVVWLFIGLFYTYKRLDDQGMLAEKAEKG